MNRLLLALAALTLTLPVAACSSISLAQMARPASLAEASATPINGIGYGQKGSFAVGQNTVAYTRSSQRLSFFNLYNMKDGGLSFRMQGADVSRGLSVDCVMRERTITIDPVEFKPAPMALGCDVRSVTGEPIAAMLEIQETAPDFSNREQRRGVVMVDGARLNVRSVHDMQGGIIPTPAPLGYVFERNGVAVGGVDLNNGPMMFEAGVSSPAEHQAVLLAAVALSIFWDPATLDN